MSYAIRVYERIEQGMTVTLFKVGQNDPLVGFVVLHTFAGPVDLGNLRPVTIYFQHQPGSEDVTVLSRPQAKDAAMALCSYLNGGARP